MTPARVVTVTGANGLRGTIETTTWPRDGSQAKVLVQLDGGRQVVVPLGALHRQEDRCDALQLDPAALEVRQSTGSHVSGRPPIVEARRPVRVTCRRDGATVEPFDLEQSELNHTT